MHRAQRDQAAGDRAELREALIAYAFATNAIFLALSVAIGVVFLPRALDLVLHVRASRAAGVALPERLLPGRTDS